MKGPVFDDGDLTSIKMALFSQISYLQDACELLDREKDSYTIGLLSCAEELARDIHEEITHYLDNKYPQNKGHVPASMKW